MVVADKPVCKNTQIYPLHKPLNLKLQSRLLGDYAFFPTHFLHRLISNMMKVHIYIYIDIYM